MPNIPTSSPLATWPSSTNDSSQITREASLVYSLKLSERDVDSRLLVVTRMCAMFVVCDRASGPCLGEPGLGQASASIARHATMLSDAPNSMLARAAAGCLPNKGMAHCLSKLEAEVRASGEPNASFKANAFRKASSVIGTHREKLTSAKEAGKLPGVGKGVMALIEEYLETGVMGEKDKEAHKEKAEAKEDKAKEDAKENAGKKTAAPAKQSGGLAFL